jgi:hypothetical protein
MWCLSSLSSRVQIRAVPLALLPTHRYPYSHFPLRSWKHGLSSPNGHVLIAWATDTEAQLMRYCLTARPSIGYRDLRVHWTLCDVRSGLTSQLNFSHGPRDSSSVRTRAPPLIFSVHFVSYIFELTVTCCEKHNGFRSDNQLQIGLWKQNRNID